MYGENNESIDLIYKPVEKKSNEKKVRIFGEDFVRYNKDKCKIRYKDEEYDLKEYFNDIDINYNNKDMIKFKLTGVNRIKDMSWMFYKCDLIKSLDIISPWNTSNVEYMDLLFYGCHSLISLPDNFIL